MAEPGKSVTAGKLAINVQKRLSRAQEKVLQKLGKADETRDVVFEEMVAKFNKQMSEGTKLHKDLKAYMAAVKTMHDASRRLQDCLADMYDPEWFGKEEMDTLVEDTDTLWLDYHQNINDKSLNTLDTYVTQFPDIKARIAKRDRKMVDFDSARHHFASLQKGKKKDEAKIAKLSQNLNDIMTNLEEQRQLNCLHDFGVPLRVDQSGLQAGLSQNPPNFLPHSKESNHSESASSAPKRPGPPPSRPELTPSPDQSHNPFGGQNTGSDANTEITTTAPQAPSLGEQNPEEQQQYDSDQYPEEARGGWDYSEGNTHDYSHPSWDDAQTAQDNWDAAHSYSEPSWDIGGTQVGQGGWADDEEAQGVVASGSDPELPPGFIYKVKAIHDYTPTDNDEMELKMGDVVLALAFDNPDEQDDGWLLGVKESHWVQHKDISVKGVFPENFTQKV
ncbi:hypothetical protein fugu_002295 [Takifugu bimaculatus]|uniref:Myc box-dependent-interacting protein 1 n=1 Tax=Takifugu bimaculatus TaxID=433685 RepID=A0A4Z2BPY7_9TELE|nr:hypothetical protein fugu_002295 [Takifugu bimaculatus]